MNLKTAVFCLFAIALTQSALSQTEIKSGYYIDTNSLKVPASFFVNDLKKTINLVECEVNGLKKSLTPLNCKLIDIQDFKQLQPATIVFHKNLISGESLPDEFSDDLDTVNTFLSVLTKGYYSLYQYENNYRNYFFYQIENGPIQELVYRVKNKDFELIEDNNYKAVLYSLAEKENLLSTAKQKLSKTGYKTQDLTSYIKLLNKDKSPTTEKDATTGIKITVLAGAQLYTFPTRFGSYYSDSARMNSATAPKLGFAIEYVLPAKKHGWSIGASMWYSSINTNSTVNSQSYQEFSSTYYYTTTSIENISLKTKNIHLDIFSNFTVNPKATLKLTFKVGMSSRIAVGSTNSFFINSTSTTVGLIRNVPTSNTYYSNNKYYDTKETYAVPFGGFSLQYKRHGLEFNFYGIGNANTQKPYRINYEQNWIFKIGGFGAHYYFEISNSSKK